MTGDLNMNGKKIRNLLTTNENDEAATKKYADNLLHNHQIISTHLKNEFDYLMSNVLEWTELTPLGYSFDMPKTDILSAKNDNFHSYNKKVIYTTLIKNTQGGYSYKMGIQCHRLQRNINYTMCTSSSIAFLSIAMSFLNKRHFSSSDSSILNLEAIAPIFFRSGIFADKLIFVENEIARTLAGQRIPKHDLE